MMQSVLILFDFISFFPACLESLLFFWFFLPFLLFSFPCFFFIVLRAFLFFCFCFFNLVSFLAFGLRFCPFSFCVSFLFSFAFFCTLHFSSFFFSGLLLPFLGSNVFITQERGECFAPPSPPIGGVPQVPFGHLFFLTSRPFWVFALSFNYFL